MQLDTAGTVTHYSPAAQGEVQSNVLPDLVGHNLFRDVAPIAQVQEFRDRFQVFVQSPLPAEDFNLTFNDCAECVHARITLAQVTAEQQQGNRKLVLVHVAKA